MSKKSLSRISAGSYVYISSACALLLGHRPSNSTGIDSGDGVAIAAVGGGDGAAVGPGEAVAVETGVSGAVTGSLDAEQATASKSTTATRRIKVAPFGR